MYVSLIVLAAMALPVPVLIRSIQKGTAPYRAVLEGVISAAVGTVFIMAVASASGTGVFELMMENIRTMAEILAGDPGVAKAIGPDLTTAERAKLLTGYYEQAARMFPASICVLGAISAYIEYILLSKFVKRKPGATPAIPMEAIRNFDLPRNAGVCWLALLLLSWLLMKADVTGMNLVYVNINGLFNFVFCLQGISVLFMYVYKKGAPKAMAVIITVLFFFSSIGKLVLMILGFTDLMLGLKKRMNGYA